MSMKTNLKKALVIAIMAAIVGLITMGSGLIAKFFMKASHCSRTKLFLFITGIIFSILYMILAALYMKFDTEDNYRKQIMDWMEREQYRYYEETPPAGGLSGKGEY
jgi:putative Mn2+ efflux pump MntP